MMRNWAFFLLAFAVGLGLVTASTLVRYNQHTPFTLQTLRPGEHVDVGPWRFRVAVPLQEAAVPDTPAGSGLNSLGERIDPPGAAWLYAEITAEPLPGIDFELSSCSLELRAGDDRWGATDLITQRATPICNAHDTPQEVGVVQNVGSYFQVPTSRLDDEPYLVVLVPGFPARAVAVSDS